MFDAMLVGIDGTRHTHNILDIAAGLAQRTGARLHVLCAVDPAYFLEEPDGQRPSRTDETDFPAAGLEREGADDLVRAAVSDLRTKGVDAHGSVIAGEPVEVILRVAAAEECNAIVLGHRHLLWLARVTERSICHAVLEGATIPVLVVPSVAG